MVGLIIVGIVVVAVAVIALAAYHWPARGQKELGGSGNPQW